MPRPNLTPTFAPLAAIAIATLATACGSSKPDQSSLEWAHGRADQILGSPIGRLEGIKQGFDTDFDKLRICVETGKPKISDSELVLETKLAYAMWLKNSGDYGQDDFNKFEFVKQAKCSFNDKSLAGAVVLGDFAKEEAGDNYRGQFNEPKMSCSGGGCSYSLTLGWGGSGWLSYRYFTSNPNKWTELVSGAPATTLLSPYVEWTSLKKGISIEPGVSSATKSAVTDAYNGLLAESSPSFAKLTAFGQLLTEKKLIMRYNEGFQQRFEEVINSSNSNGSFSFTPRQAQFHTLLHEVGHQFGMNHADNPGPDAITGSVAGGNAVTEDAAMAYGDPYFYLTADDRAGAAHAGGGVKSTLSQHK